MSSSLRHKAPVLAALLACASLTAVTAAHAHQVWLENAGGQARLHFGEFNENLRETSPGSLDKFKGVPALEQRTGTAAQRVDGQLGKDGFNYTVAGTPDTLFAAATYPLIDRSKRNLPAMYWQPSARWVAGLTQAVAPTAPLDLVPTGKPGEFKVVYKGAPLPKAKVQLAAPSGWTREAEAAEDGTVTFVTPWKGQYVAEVKHSDKTPGEAQGEKYGEASYVTTLTFVLADGMVSPALPAPPKAH
ncbi:TonB-dependent receptor [Acidovorax sp. Leaf76]|uniref:TonB-dependent receptor n=1 Tax=unclassified Acidovorax TaxID=2684926 RepID=UPI000700FF69|nr:MULTISPECIES: TonB-dependent receptor [unclassified Acidovorax]KQO25905.1 TonB-dependent receptor [Acidovorax sp. Leaf76]KQO28754.1 TonB-dependent receptor [Acidovorax sp. Leaf84]KQS40687.1 TonB-dependent receptor [Acidovorax sp. Leaf191]